MSANIGERSMLYLIATDGRVRYPDHDFDVGTFRPRSAPGGTRSDFFFHRIFPKVVAVIDCGMGGRSVTNDIENVVEYLYGAIHLSTGDVLIYRDTDGKWDRVCHVAGRFLRFQIVQADGVKDCLDWCLGAGNWGK
jgi:hypothetical protein